jgi:hypothetical protein
MVLPGEKRTKGGLTSMIDLVIGLLYLLKAFLNR